MPDEQIYQHPREVLVPVPDPTVMTIDALDRAVGNLRDLIFARLDAMDVATDLHLEAAANLPAVIRRDVADLEKLGDERFKAVEQRFHDRDARFEVQTAANKEALAAALVSARELTDLQSRLSATARDKSEATFTKQIDQISALITASEKAQQARTDELKERFDRGDGETVGSRMQKADLRTNVNIVYMVVGLIVGVIVAGLAVYSAVKP